MPIRYPFSVSLALLTLFASPVDAQTIRGVVLDEEARLRPGALPENRGVAGAEVELRRDGRRAGAVTLTDTLGRFTLTAPGVGTFGLRVTHPAYLAHESEGIELGEGEILSLEIRMGRNVIPLEPLVVTARMSSLMAGFHQRRTSGGMGTFLTREEIEVRGAAKATDLLRGMPGVRIEFERWGIGPSIVMQGGFGLCEPAIFVDGIETVRSSGVGSSLDDYLTPERIEGIEVYTSFSTVPAQYQSGMCGVILIWTRPGERGEGEPWGWKRMLLGFAAAIGLILWIR